MDVAGLICVDSAKAGAFRDVEGPSREYDLNIMKQLTRCAFASFREIDSIAEIVKHVQATDGSDGHAS
jgi:hypothetical protein